VNPVAAPSLNGASMTGQLYHVMREHQSSSVAPPNEQWNNFLSHARGGRQRCQPLFGCQSLHDVSSQCISNYQSSPHPDTVSRPHHCRQTDGTAGVRSSTGARWNYAGMTRTNPCHQLNGILFVGAKHGSLYIYLRND